MNNMRKFDCKVYGPSKLEGQKRELGAPFYQNVVHAKSAAEATAIVEASAMLQNSQCVIQVIADGPPRG